MTDCILNILYITSVIKRYIKLKTNDFM